MKVISNEEKLIDELKLILKLFYNDYQIENDNLIINCNVTLQNNILTSEILITGDVCLNNKKDVQLTNEQTKLLSKYLRRYSKLALYEALVKITGIKQPWGAITGIRPTKIFYELKKEFKSALIAKDELIKSFYVSPEKAEIVFNTVKNQTKIEINDNLVDLYVNIPFCTSKCYYCSFISTPLKNCENLVDPYINALIKEIRAVKDIINKNNYIVKTIYVGGGTPTAINCMQLDRILSELSYPVNEFTVEAGRPDTITKEKLDVLKKHNVTRISINPQTFSNKTLKEIGRAHCAKDIINAYNLAKPYNFIINMDLIAGLGNESFNTFKNNIIKALSLNPDNITVHTLSVKRTSDLKENNLSLTNKNEVEKMINYSYKTLTEQNYLPYYLYKQKNMIGNLENIGYCKPKTECLFNIDSMEEVATIIACGANAISKRFFSLTNRIERQPNVKNLNEYINRIDEIIEKKEQFFK